MKEIKPKTLLIAVGLIIIAAAAAYSGGLFSAVDNGIIKGDIRCSGDNTKYVFKIDFYTPDAGEHHVQAFCADNPRYQVMRLAVVYMPAGDINTVTVERDCDDWDALMPCDTIDFQLYNANRGVVYWRTDDDSVPTCITAPPPVPCSGLPECSSATGWYQECCSDKVWTCYWNNYDGAGYRFQWDLQDTCDADCTCDGAATEQDCWCADLTPDCNGLGICDHDVYFCEACCGGDVWRCQGHYKWSLKGSCTSDETCECTGGECLSCDCEATPTPTPTPSPARIDDSTDTLVFDKSTYQLGDTVSMSATGRNIGGENWQGKVTFTITQPDGSVYTVEEASGISVAAGASATAGESFILPPAGQSGTWTAQSMWITDDGVIAARSSVLALGEEDDSEDNGFWIIGGFAVFLLLTYVAFRKTRGE